MSLERCQRLFLFAVELLSLLLFSHARLALQIYRSKQTELRFVKHVCSFDQIFILSTKNKQYDVKYNYFRIDNAIGDGEEVDFYPRNSQNYYSKDKRIAIDRKWKVFSEDFGRKGREGGSNLRKGMEQVEAFADK